MSRTVWKCLLRTSRRPYEKPQRKKREMTKERGKINSFPRRKPVARVGAAMGIPPAIVKVVDKRRREGVVLL